MEYDNELEGYAAAGWNLCTTCNVHWPAEWMEDSTCIDCLEIAEFGETMTEGMLGGWNTTMEYNNERNDLALIIAQMTSGIVNAIPEPDDLEIADRVIQFIENILSSDSN